MSKCQFMQKHVEYLGHIISGEGVRTDPKKIAAIVQWKTPVTITQLRRILGMTGYYRRFIENYATICHPLYAMLKKDSFSWGPEQDAAFLKLKQVMSNPPLLALPDFSILFSLETDACASGLGAVLMQKGKPLAYFSRNLGPNNSARSIYEKEAMAILEALKKWRHYFLGNTVLIKTDQSSLKYLNSERLIEGIQHKLMLKLLEFDYKIDYKKGVENKVADALSRQKTDHLTDQEETDECLTTSIAIPAWTLDVTSSYVEDDNCLQLLQQLAIKQDDNSPFTLQSGILRYKGRIYIGKTSDLQERIFQSFHSSIFGGHSGNRVTYHRIKQLFYWPGLKKYSETKISQCPVCQIYKNEKIKYPGLLHTLPIPQTKWSEISMDFVEGLPKAKGKDVILVIVDRLTKYAHFISLSHPYTVQTVAHLIMDHIIKLHGPPAVIVSDRDRIFTSKLWHKIFSALKVSLHFSTAYHPESDGQTERVNQCVEQYLRCMTFSAPKKWVDWLPAAEWWYNSSYHSSIKMSPFQALYEYAPPMLSQLIAPPGATAEAQHTIGEHNNMTAVLQHNLAVAQKAMKTQADKKRTARSFNLGDMVYLKMQPHREHALGSGNPLKLCSKWYGPFKVIKEIGKRAYKLQLPVGTQLHDVFHVNQLKKHLGTHAIPNPRLPLVTDAGKLKLAPFAVPDRRQLPRSAGAYDVAVPQWLIQWDNMTVEEATWEDAEFVLKTFPDFKP